MVASLIEWPNKRTICANNLKTAPKSCSRSKPSGNEPAIWKNCNAFKPNRRYSPKALLKKPSMPKIEVIS